ncbi:hypothetical protein BDV30DRAFT_247683 [Aspergillus minisclerotigenes]|uniref:Uncharacterized protein n=1 Tax=Aspergillus minisclerotigenes TaxID=656917 RepID=A0A5N6IJK8_9EURO|nr:hypothetical protein BDV30DRAFT_247683 [Aspergillus minisclerotigenes]
MPATVTKGKRGRPRKYASEQERQGSAQAPLPTSPQATVVAAGTIPAELPVPSCGETEPPPLPPVEDYLDQFLPSCGALETPLAGEAAGDDGHESEVGPPRAGFTHHPPRGESGHLAKRLADQLIQHHGCCGDCHAQASQAHHEQHKEHCGLQSYLEDIQAGEAFPDVLSQNRTTAARKEQVYNGISADPSSSSPLHICLQADFHPPSSSSVTFDIDSIVGYPTSLAVAKQGIRWHPTQMMVSDLQSSLHLSPVQVSYVDKQGCAHTVRRPVHKVPHYTFGRVAGFEDISLYLLFPQLYREEQQCSRLRDEDFTLWMDQILLPAIYKHYPSSLTQHYPSSCDHSRSNATARGVEMRSQRVDPVAREQMLFYFLPPDALRELWETIQEKVQMPGLQHFQGVQILLQAKNLKTVTKDVTWQKMIDRFEQYWHHAIIESYATTGFFFAIGKEVCPSGISKVALQQTSFSSPLQSPEESQAQTLLWRRCCLDSYAAWAPSAQGSADDGFHQTFYPMSMLQDTGSLTLETHAVSWSRQAGLLYSQFYSSVKEIFAAGNIYPFTNTAIENLALDPKLRKTWQAVGGGLSNDPIALTRAYLYTKQRCHHALQGSPGKSFGTREEHRVSQSLLEQIHLEFQRRQLHQVGFPTPLEPNLPFYSLSTQTVLDWFRWNINKFCVGFEMVHSLNDHHFVTWEHTRVMLMFLRCLQFSYSTGLIQRVGGCWHDIKYQPDATQSDGIRRWEGLGFRDTMQRFGYAWFLDKINWSTLTFRQPFAQYMMFNNPSMQAVYRARYPQIRDVRIDFIRVDQARQWMLEFSSIPTCQAYLMKYLRQLCLRAFRQDVFTHIKPQLKKDHWLLPYPQSQGFMRKDKETGQFVWWSSIHRGLARYYRQLYGPSPSVLPASYIKHHPSTHWQRAENSLDFMNYTVRPEQRLVHLTNTDLYQQLQDLQAQFNRTSHPTHLPLVEPSLMVYEMQDPSYDYLDRAARAPMESWSTITCSYQLQKALEEYSILQHQHINLRRRRVARDVPDDHSDSQAEASSELEEDEEMTSDEESLSHHKQRHVTYIQSIERQMYQVICNDRKECWARGGGQATTAVTAC